MENFGKTMAFILPIIISPIIFGFVLMKLWFWFVVPTFEVETLNLVQIMGLVIIVDLLTSKHKK